MGFSRGGRGFGGGGGGRGRGFGNRGGGRGGGRGGYGQSNEPPESVVEFGTFTHECENQLVVKAGIEQVPFFNAPMYLENKEQVGKVDEIFGSIRDYSVSVVLRENFKASSFKPDQKLYIDPNKLLPLERFLPKPPGEKKRGGGGRGRGGRGGRGGSDRGRGGGGFRGGRGGNFGNRDSGGRGGFGGRDSGGRGGGGFNNRDGGGRGGRDSGGGFGGRGRGGSGGFRGGGNRGFNRS